MKLHCFVILECCQKGNFYFIQLIFMPLRIVTTALSSYEYVIIAIYKSFKNKGVWFSEIFVWNINICY